MRIFSGEKLPCFKLQDDLFKLETDYSLDLSELSHIIFMGTDLGEILGNLPKISKISWEISNRLRRFLMLELETINKRKHNQKPNNSFAKIYKDNFTCLTTEYTNFLDQYNRSVSTLIKLVKNNPLIEQFTLKNKIYRKEKLLKNLSAPLDHLPKVLELLRVIDKNSITDDLKYLCQDLENYLIDSKMKIEAAKILRKKSELELEKIILLDEIDNLPKNFNGSNRVFIKKLDITSDQSNKIGKEEKLMLALFFVDCFIICKKRTVLIETRSCPFYKNVAKKLNFWKSEKKLYKFKYLYEISPIESNFESIDSFNDYESILGGYVTKFGQKEKSASLNSITNLIPKVNFFKRIFKKDNYSQLKSDSSNFTFN